MIRTWSKFLPRVTATIFVDLYQKATLVLLLVNPSRFNDKTPLQHFHKSGGCYKSGIKDTFLFLRSRPTACHNEALVDVSGDIEENGFDRSQRHFTLDQQIRA